MQESQIDLFFAHITRSLTDKTFVKLVISDRINRNHQVRNLQVKLLEIKGLEHISVVSRFDTRDEVKNYKLKEGLEMLKSSFESTYNQADLFTTSGNVSLTRRGQKWFFKETAAVFHQTPDLSHDRKKNRLISTAKNDYLRLLGVLNDKYVVVPAMNDKFRQIQKYIEILDHLFEQLRFEGPLNVVDMGAGKGYLTFSLYDYLSNYLHKESRMTGVEFRQELVERCNEIAGKVGFHSLKFIQGTIEKAEIGNVDILIALHACDTATDEAIFKGIRAGARVIVCAPCCHKQIRGQMQSNPLVFPLLKHGIIKERQAELVTDSLRALLLEAHGYQTKVFEFVSNEHTAKNLMITAIKKKTSVLEEDHLEELRKIKEFYGIQYHYLEKLLGLG